MCHAQVGAWGSAMRTSGTSSFVGVHLSTIGTGGLVGGASSAAEGELFPSSSLPGTSRGSTGRGLPESSFRLFWAIVAEDTEG